jgi:hypothetical protein
MTRATLSATPSAPPPTDDCRQAISNQREAAACAAIEQRARRLFTGAEWATARARLIEFAGILQAWERTAHRRGNVEVLCQREP